VDGEVVFFPLRFHMSPKLFNIKRGLLAVTILVASCCVWHLIANWHLNSANHLAALVGFTLPEGSIVADRTGDYTLFDSSHSWIVEMPSNQPRPWQSSLAFHECLPTENPSDDFHHIRDLAATNFPQMASCFKAAKAWRGGREGNCYILEGEGGQIVFFHYFST